MLKSALTDRSGFLSIQALWIMAIVVFLASGLTIRASLSIKVTDRMLNRTRLEMLVSSHSEIIRRQLASADSISCGMLGMCGVRFDRFHSTTLIVERDTFVIEVSPGAALTATGERESMDEEALINLNAAPDFLLRNLMLNGQQIRDIVEYRRLHRYGESSDVVSSPRDVDVGPFYTIDDLLTFESFSWQDVKRLRGLLTTYGNGTVNINTASEEVILITGCPPSLAGKILSAREQGDGSVSGSGGYIFTNTDRIIADLIGLGFDVTADEANYLKHMANYGIFGTRSEYFSYTVECRRLNSSSGCVLSEIVRLTPGKEPRVVQRFLRNI